MQETKRHIIFVEGLPGTGKSTIAKWIHEELGFELMLEFGDNYPNDMFEIAGMSIDTYTELCIKHPVLEEFGEEYKGYIYINIGRVKDTFLHNKELIGSLAKWDLGDELNKNIDIQFYISCSLTYLKKQFDLIKNAGIDIVIDSSWLQNPINELLLRNVDTSQVVGYCEEILKNLAEQKVLCIYLKRRSAVDSINFASKVKGEQWKNGVTEFIKSTPYGLSNKLKGYEGAITYFDRRAQIEECILDKEFIPHFNFNIKSNNWDIIKKEIKNKILESYYVS